MDNGTLAARYAVAAVLAHGRERLTPYAGKFAKVGVGGDWRVPGVMEGYPTKRMQI